MIKKSSNTLLLCATINFIVSIFIDSDLFSFACYLATSMFLTGAMVCAAIEKSDKND